MYTLIWFPCQTAKHASEWLVLKFEPFHLKENQVKSLTMFIHNCTACNAFTIFIEAGTVNTFMAFGRGSVSSASRSQIGKHRCCPAMEAGIGVEQYPTIFVGRPSMNMLAQVSEVGLVSHPGSQVKGPVGICISKSRTGRKGLFDTSKKSILHELHSGFSSLLPSLLWGAQTVQCIQTYTGSSNSKVPLLALDQWWCWA